MNQRHSENISHMSVAVSLMVENIIQHKYSAMVSDSVCVCVCVCECVCVCV